LTESECVMIVGVPSEIKHDEYRVSMLPVGVEMLVDAGHQVLIQHDAGVGSGYENTQYIAAGATIVDAAEKVFAHADMLVKVKEPLGDELDMMRPGQVVFTYFHFAASSELTQRCLDADITAVAYETLTDSKG
jgi:alanine dehydrogenase